MVRAARVAVLLLLALSVEAADRAVLIYPKERPWFRRVFYTSHQRELREQLRSRFDIEVHNQVATAEKVLQVDITGARLLLISAHGDPFALFLGADGKRTLDSRDIGRLRKFFSKLAPDATIVLQSCHNGRGFAWAVKEAAGPGRRVIAAKGVIPPDGLRITSLDPVDVRITCRGRNGPWDCTIRL
jgi:hypothetical protein